MPTPREGEELFEESLQIAQGDAFEEIFGEENDKRIKINGGDGKLIPIQ